jgi:hypothetical protein
MVNYAVDKLSSLYPMDDLYSNTNKNDVHMDNSYEGTLRFSISVYHILDICLTLVSKLMILIFLCHIVMIALWEAMIHT